MCAFYIFPFGLEHVFYALKNGCAAADVSNKLIQLQTTNTYQV